MLVVPYGAGLGINDVLECGGPGYTIDNLTDPPNGTVVKTHNLVWGEQTCAQISHGC